MLTRCYRLAPGARLETSAGRRWLRSHYPLRQVELNETAWRLLNALDGQTPLHLLVERLTPEVLGFLDARLAGGLLEARYGVRAPRELPLVRVVIPVRDNPAGLARCLAALAAQRYPEQKIQLVVVDDASAHPARDFTPTPDAVGKMVHWVRLEKNAGPATARNAGAAWPGGWNPAPGCRGQAGPAPPAVAAAASNLAFLDSDCVPGPDWLAAMVAVLDDRWVGAAGGKVEGLRRDRLLARYESACSSLQLGDRPGPAAAAGARLPYLPACNLMVSREAFAAVGGFRPGARLGEDFDLCRRLARAGYGVFYYPGVSVRHHYRDRWAPFLRRKADYAFSEAWLRRAHPGPWWRKPSRAARAGLVLGAVGLAAGGWWWALAVAIPPALEGARHHWRLRRAFAQVPRRLRWLASLRRGAGIMLSECRAAARETMALWLPLIVAAPRLAVLAAPVALAAGIAEWRARRPPLRWWEFAVGFGAECMAYSFGRVVGFGWQWTEPARRRVASCRWKRGQ
ncbi:MAG: glycosyltransferase [bacterium]